MSGGVGQIRMCGWLTHRLASDWAKSGALAIHGSVAFGIKMRSGVDAPPQTALGRTNPDATRRLLMIKSYVLSILLFFLAGLLLPTPVQCKWSPFAWDARPKLLYRYGYINPPRYAIPYPEGGRLGYYANLQENAATTDPQGSARAAEMVNRVLNSCARSRSGCSALDRGQAKQPAGAGTRVSFAGVGAWVWLFLRCSGACGRMGRMSSRRRRFASSPARNIPWISF